MATHYPILTETCANSFVLFCFDCRTD